MALSGRRNVRRDQVRSIEDLRKHTTTSGECWLWSGSKSDGVGKVFTSNLQWEPAHVVAWRLTHPRSQAEPIQTCGRLACVRPEHLSGRIAVEAPRRRQDRQEARVASRETVKARAPALCEICGKPATHWMERAHLFGRGRRGIVCDALADQPEFSVWAHVGCHRALDSYTLKGRQEAMRWGGVGLMAARYGLDPPFVLFDPEWTPQRAAQWIEATLREAGILQRLAGRGWVLTA